VTALSRALRDRIAQLDSQIKEGMDRLDVLSARRNEVASLLLLVENAEMEIPVLKPVRVG
jgi:hypothetical protein